MKLKTTLFIIISLLSVNSLFAQNARIAFSAGPAFMYVDEHLHSDNSYYNGIASQVDYIFLDSAKKSNFSISIHSNSVDLFQSRPDGYVFMGQIMNTSISISKYFVKKFRSNLTGNLQIGSGFNHETTYYNRSKLFLNVQAGGELNYHISDNWSILVKGLAVGQDVPNIIRYFYNGYYQEAGEDLHLMLLFGLAFNIGK